MAGNSWQNGWQWLADVAVAVDVADDGNFVCFAFSFSLLSAFRKYRLHFRHCSDRKIIMKTTTRTTRLTPTNMHKHPECWYF